MMAVAQRDRDAFRTLFESYAPRLLGFFLKRGASSASAEELVQEVMLLVWRKAERYDPKRGGVSTWVFTVARNIGIDRLRREKRPEPDMEDPTLVVGGIDTPEQETGQAHEVRALREALAGLPPEQAEVVRSAYFEGKAMSEIAGEQRVPVGTVKTRVRLALARLRAVLPGTRN